MEVRETPEGRAIDMGTLYAYPKAEGGGWVFSFSARRHHGQGSPFITRERVHEILDEWMDDLAPEQMPEPQGDPAETPG